MFPLFQRAFQTRGDTIAGMTLKPMTLAHAYTLCAWESPLILGGKIEPSDFAVALWTCTQDCWPFDVFFKGIEKGLPEKELAKLGKKYALKNITEDIHKLQDYIEWHCKFPPRFIKDKTESKGSCSPWPLIIAVQIIPLIGEQRAWTIPVPMAMSYKIALDNAAGDSSWKTEVEEKRGFADACNS